MHVCVVSAACRVASVLFVRSLIHWSPVLERVVSGRLHDLHSSVLSQVLRQSDLHLQVDGGSAAGAPGRRTSSCFVGALNPREEEDIDLRSKDPWIGGYADLQGLAHHACLYEHVYNHTLKMMRTETIAVCHTPT